MYHIVSSECLSSKRIITQATMRRKIKWHVNRYTSMENVYNIFIVIILLAATMFFIQLTHHLNTRTITSENVDQIDNFEEVKLRQQITQNVIRLNSGVTENSDREWNSSSIKQNVTRVKQVNNTGDELNNNTNAALITGRMPIDSNDLFKVVINRTKVDKISPDNDIKLNGNYFLLNKNNETRRIGEDKEFGNDIDKTIDNSTNHLQDGSIRIVKSHSAVSRLLADKARNGTLLVKNYRRPNYCSLWPDKLVGRMNIDAVINSTDIPEANRMLVDKGGVFKPTDCSPRERTAIIIPYRDRDKHLQILLSHLHKVLQRQMIEYGIYVIEMAFPTQFNRGLLANVGFLTASSINSYTCYIIHDVDLLMEDDRNMYRCGRVPRHLTATNSKYKDRLPYLAYFGGVVAFTPEQYWKVNGFSNLYFGWGGEDDDMVYRIFRTNQHFSRPKPRIGGYTAIEHSSDTANPVNPNRAALVKSAVDRMSVDGVRSVIYQRLALEFKPLYTWVYVSVQEAKIMHKYEQYLQDTD